MLVTDRRHRILFLALAGMEIGWFAPIALLLIGYWQGRLDFPLLRRLELQQTADALSAILTFPPLVTFAFFFLLMVFYMLMADLLNQHQLFGAARAATIVVMITGTSLFAVRILIYGNMPGTDLRWLGAVWSAVFNFTAGRRPETIILLLNAFLWFRVANSTDRDLTFLGVGLSFRTGILLAIAGGALLAGKGGQPPGSSLVYFFLFMVFGLAAVAIARIDEKALLVDDSRGGVLPWRQVALTGTTAVVTTVIGYLLALVYTPGNIRTVLDWFSPLWALIRLVLSGLIFALAWLLAPLLERSVRFLQWVLSQIEPVEVAQNQQPVTPDFALRPSDLTTLLDRTPVVRYALVLLLIAACLFLIWFFFLRTERRTLSDEDEEYELESVTFGGGLLQRGWDRLRNLFDLVQRYGLSGDLLAAISIQNIYANISRLARQRGFPRRPSLPPDYYLAELEQAFPACHDALERITAAYMRVEYGNQTLADLELESLRSDYQFVRNAPAPNEADEANA